MAQVKIDGVWRELAEAWAKVDGQWRKVDTVQSKIDGVWRDAWTSSFRAPRFIIYPATITRGDSFTWSADPVTGASYELQYRYNSGSWSSSTFHSQPTATFQTSDASTNSTIQLRIRALEPNTRDKASAWTEGEVRSLAAQKTAMVQGLSYPSSLTRGKAEYITWHMLGNTRYTLEAIYDDGAYIATVHNALAGSPKTYTINSNSSYNTVYFRIKAQEIGSEESNWLVGPKVTLNSQKLDVVPNISAGNPVSGSTINVAWGAVKYATNYLAEVQYNDGVWTRIYFGPNRTTSIKIRDYAASALTVHYRVRATANGYGDGDWKVSPKQNITEPPLKVSQWEAHKLASWRTRFGWRDPGDVADPNSINYMYQGSWNEPPYWGNHRGLAWFDTDNMKKYLNGKQIVKTELYMFRVNKGGYTAGQPITLYTHNYTGVPTEMPLLNFVQGPFSSFARGEGKWVTVSNTIVERILDNKARGVALFQEEGKHYLYMNRVAIKVHYR